ncbi:MAG: T9SS type A sorting domain-containing protein [Chitinophaga sp.]|uniref:T9SS type A sorting domain-containing protein n=1 Tax=Chitinophaga sp. TaxID=1869181 RepID=UPI001B1D5E05|nr:T9SS type A sorting domain-containing protein [Chitinophaga sp.]MBO9727921.1 T9SS type A sorting domain-containing protein [Chitinophaga sp.]
MRTFVLSSICALLLLHCVCTSSQAQVILNRQVNAVSGGQGVVQNIHIQYTIGEAVVLPITNGKTLLTQGFQQPEELPKLPPGATPVKNYVIFPNPAVTNTKIQFDLLTNASITIEVINPAGQNVYHQFLQLGTGRNLVVLPVNHFAAGIYTVMLTVNGNVFFEKLIVQ